MGSGSADGACAADDFDCYSGSVQDRFGMEAIASLHRQLDDDDNGNIDLSESDDVCFKSYLNRKSKVYENHVSMTRNRCSLSWHKLYTRKHIEISLFRLLSFNEQYHRRAFLFFKECCLFYVYLSKIWFHWNVYIVKYYNDVSNSACRTELPFLLLKKK